MIPLGPAYRAWLLFLARQLSTVAYPWSGSQVQTPGTIGQSSRPESRHQSLHLSVWWGEHFYCLLDEKHRLTFQNDRGQYDIEDNLTRRIGDKTTLPRAIILSTAHRWLYNCDKYCPPACFSKDEHLFKIPKNKSLNDVQCTAHPSIFCFVFRNKEKKSCSPCTRLVEFKTAFLNFQW